MIRTLVTAAAFCLTGHACTSSSVSTQAPEPPTSTSAEDEHRYDDGPHVYWQTDSRVIAFYTCEGDVQQRAFEVPDTLRLAGFCRDSTTEYLVPARAPSLEPSVVKEVPRIFAVSDIHGEFEALTDLLQRAGIIDAGLHWSWGDGHLVILGDVFDRGDKVTECLWLIYRLEQEAQRAGGRVHFVLGNHEVIVMRGDLRYVSAKYLDGIVRRSRIKYEDLYGPAMELGRWLRTKHVAVILNGILFVHGGFPPAALERGLGLDEVNAAARKNIDIKSYELAFSDTAKFLYGSGGPLWYRGYHEAQEGRYPKASAEELALILRTLGAEAIVVGHTEVPEVEALYDGRVFAIDVPVPDLGSLQGLLWQDGRFYRVAGNGSMEALN
ncbi:MAG: metallophosphoesterase [Gemmatimonadota bacterium]|nr:MAG: metallophosphoesterase [Gemmatimonadota bacterium]